MKNVLILILIFRLTFHLLIFRRTFFTAGILFPVTLSPRLLVCGTNHWGNYLHITSLISEIIWPLCSPILLKERDELVLICVGYYFSLFFEILCKLFIHLLLLAITSMHKIWMAFYCLIGRAHDNLILRVESRILKICWVSFICLPPWRELFHTFQPLRQINIQSNG